MTKKQRLEELDKMYNDIMDQIDETDDRDELERLGREAQKIEKEWAELTGEDKEEELPYFDDYMKDLEFSIGSCDEETRMWILHNWYK